jgi:hypothetical protein
MRDKIKKYKTTTGKIWGDETQLSKLNCFSKCSAANLNEYKNQLEKMDSFDLQKHATEVGEIPRDNREILITILLKNFEERL